MYQSSTKKVVAGHLMNCPHVFACDFAKDLRGDDTLLVIDDLTKAIFRVSFKVSAIFKADEGMFFHVIQIGH